VHCVLGNTAATPLCLEEIKYEFTVFTHSCKMFRGSQKFIVAEVYLRFWSVEKLMRHLPWLQQERRCKNKGKIQPGTGGEDPERD